LAGEHIDWWRRRESNPNAPLRNQLSSNILAFFVSQCGTGCGTFDELQVALAALFTLAEWHDIGMVALASFESLTERVETGRKRPENCALPLNPWLASGDSSIWRAVWYRVTAGGHAAPQDGFRLRNGGGGTPKKVATARKHYLRCLQEEGRRLAGPRRAPREIGPLPLPVSFDGLGY